jgi:hypothetical protein
MVILWLGLFVASYIFGIYTGWYIRHEELKDEIDRLTVKNRNEGDRQ